MMDNKGELTLTTLLFIVLLMLVIYAIFSDSGDLVMNIAYLLVLVFVQIMFFTVCGAVVMTGELLVALARGDWDRAADVGNRITAQITGAVMGAVRVVVFKRGLRL